MKAQTLSNNIFLESINNFQKSSAASVSKDKFSNYSRKFKKNSSFFIPLIIFIVIILVVVFGFLRRDSSSSNAQISESSSDSLQTPIAQADINKTFTFKVENSEGDDVNVGYIVDSAELRDSIVIRGQVANAVPGRDFLIVNLRLKNDTQSPVDFNARDYIRFIIGESDEKFAPDIHNDPVTIQPISTKNTRVGIPVDEGEENLKIQVGEISGKKEVIEIKF